MTPASEWWYLVEDEVGAAYGLAVDEYLARQRRGRPTLRLYTYRNHCALVGRFQNLESAVHLEACRRRGISVGRRLTGGGAILMGADQLGLTLALPGAAGAGWADAQAVFERYGEPIRLALCSLGLDAKLRGKNDIEVAGRKVAGMGLWSEANGSLLFQTSVLVGLDLNLMVEVLRTPFEKLQDKGVRALSERLTTIRAELGSEVTVDTVREHVRASFERALGVKLRRRVLSPLELAAVRKLMRFRYANRRWIYQPHLLPSTHGSALLKTPGGLLEVTAAVKGGALERVYVQGDFFATDTAVRGLEQALRWLPCEEDAVRAAIRDAWAAGYRLANVTPDELARCVLDAASRAQREGQGQA